MRRIVVKWMMFVPHNQDQPRTSVIVAKAIPANQFTYYGVARGALDHMNLEYDGNRSNKEFVTESTIRLLRKDT